MTEKRLYNCVMVTYDSPEFFSAKTAIIGYHPHKYTDKSGIKSELCSRLNLDEQKIHIHNITYLGNVDCIEVSNYDNINDMIFINKENSSYKVLITSYSYSGDIYYDLKMSSKTTGRFDTFEFCNKHDLMNNLKHKYRPKYLSESVENLINFEFDLDSDNLSIIGDALLDALTKHANDNDNKYM